MILHFAFLCSAVFAADETLRLVKSWKADSPAVLVISPMWRNKSSPALLATSFHGKGVDPIYFVPGLAGLFGNMEPTVALLGNDTLWANEVKPTPHDIFGRSDIVQAAGGFLVPKKGVGTIDFYRTSSTPSKAVKISTDENHWFFHKTEWFDMNGDGHRDLVAARANVNTMNPFMKWKGELVWYENPGTMELPPAGTAYPWKMHTVVSGPDVAFEILTMPDGRVVVIATEFFSAPQLALYYCDQPSWGNCEQNDVTRVVIDDKSTGPFFDLEYVDVNNDGRKDLLVTNNRHDGKGKVLVYEVPDNYKTEPWTRHVLRDGYSVSCFICTGKGTPGRARSVHPRTNASGKPMIALSTDDGGQFVLLNPTSTETSSWNYTETVIYKTTVDKGTVGTFDIGDVNGDGYNEIFVPDYSGGVVAMYTFAPSKTSIR